MRARTKQRRTVWFRAAPESHSRSENGDFMTKRNFCRVVRWLPKWCRGLVISLGLAAVFAVVSCSSVRRSVVNLPTVPGAKYLGSKDCEQCHEKIYRDFIASADHARLMTPGPNAL